MIIQEVLFQLKSATSPVFKILQSSDHVKVIVLGFKRGMILKEHQTAIPAKLIIIDGSVIYKEAGRTVTMNKYEDVDIPINVTHSVEAVEDSICFLIKG
ncbi:hypothetical protein [Mucilaginibacter flavidus]|uniref:hypothetical protein n=1 Tax=Mucilaginibacter flavidus TaxID=2949309 RepID=UPI002092C95B|nr:hypothetical protein [Mucilaginibacter flavidus]MCO5948590.1 hypothetical protein [Mucilaginibacter flavidus]